MTKIAARLGARVEVRLAGDTRGLDLRHLDRPILERMAAYHRRRLAELEAAIATKR